MHVTGVAHRLPATVRSAQQRKRDRPTERDGIETEGERKRERLQRQIRTRQDGGEAHITVGIELDKDTPLDARDSIDAVHLQAAGVVLQRRDLMRNKQL